MSTSVPLPGQHLPGSGGGVDPADVHNRVDALLERLNDAGGDIEDARTLGQQAQILERAHDVLVESLAAVDKV
ncbi:hypothetical protein EGT67_13980 [Prescottella agglutinans]|uniref:Uncharacterized protein n=1 Tax=Prescottella agglutinans TaxID=1644129 RepID=A0A3S3AF41_9NOCA|nr:hypothetical protein [Prescottella agglutinans]RVW08651.1 hypothetical protein EGT67_13980 [Prescottella agglutinans]